MGILTRFWGSGAHSVGNAIREVSEVFVANKTQAALAEHTEHIAALAQYGTEFQDAPIGFFDRFVNALNRLPRPIMALGTIGLLVFSMLKPDAFSERMVGLSLVPDPLWWLLGAIVSFYFGARELHHFRKPETAGPHRRKPRLTPKKARTSDNPALDEWRDQQDQNGD